ncbi:MAG: ribosome-associated translation inhibitor RaiA [Chloroflexota bacterium]
MRTIVKGKNYEVPDAVRGYAERKVRRMERMLDDRTDVLVELSVERRRSIAESHIVEISIVIDGRPIRGHATASTHEAGVDEVLDKLERQAADVKARPRVRARAEEEKQILRRIADGTADAGRERRIVKMKRFAIEPMFDEDAVVRMEELGHAFFVFVNAETEQVAVLYRRRDGDYGMIEPVIAGDYTKGGGGSVSR